MNCYGCKKVIARQDLLTCRQCKHAVHYQCVMMSSDQFCLLRERQQGWTCPSCANITTRRKKDDTPVKSMFSQDDILDASCHDTAPTDPKEIAVSETGPTRRAVSGAQSSAVKAIPYEDFALLVDSKMRDLEISITRSINATIRSEINSAIQTLKEEFTETTDFLAAELKGLDSRMKTIEKETKKVCVLEGQISELQVRISQLQNDNNKKDQVARLNNIEIKGIPEFAQEILPLHVIRVAQLAGVALAESDIEHVHRVKPMRPVQGQPKNIVAKLKDRSLKNQIIVGIRKRRGLTTADLGIGGDPTICYVNEHLTQANKALYKKCRIFTKEKSYQYAWIKNGTIYVRKSDKDPAITISVEADLKKII